jgi:MerR family transcriptional regulator, copper efflux regulator
MSERLTIGKVSRLTGLPVRTIRFYESEGLVPPPQRTESGYRLYGEPDIARLRLLKRARMLGLDLPSIRSLLDKALGESCGEFGEELFAALARQREEIDRRVAELTAMREEIGRLEAHVLHCCEGCDTTQMASVCSFCGILNQEGGDVDERCD